MPRIEILKPKPHQKFRAKCTIFISQALSQAAGRLSQDGGVDGSNNIMSEALAGAEEIAAANETCIL